MNKITKNPLFLLAIIIIANSVHDYYEHISRKNSVFEEHPWYWLLFSTAATTSLILITFLVKKFIEKKAKTKNVITELIAIGIWLILYLYLLGPIFDRLFWPFGILNFNFNFSFFFSILASYFILRIIINLITRKKLLYSQ